MYKHKNKLNAFHEKYTLRNVLGFNFFSVTVSTADAHQ